MKQFLVLLIVAVGVIFGCEYRSTSKVTLYEHSVITRIAYYEGTRYDSYSECINNLSTDRSKYKNLEAKLNTTTPYGSKVVFAPAQCVTDSELDDMVKSAQIVNNNGK